MTVSWAILRYARLLRIGASTEVFSGGARHTYVVRRLRPVLADGGLGAVAMEIVEPDTRRMPVGDDWLLEREVALQEVDTALGAALSSQGAGLLIEGAAGIGKTRLVAAARERGRHAAMRVLSATGSWLEREMPYGIVAQLFQRTVARAAPSDVAELLGGAARLAAPLFTGDALGSGPVEAHAIRHGLFWLTSNLAEQQPLLLAVDDLHCADQSSLEFLASLATRIHDLPVAMFMAVRTGESAAHESLLRELAASPSIRRQPLAPLSNPAAAQLVRRRWPQADEEFCAACAHAAGGNPFLTEEMTRAVATGDLPQGNMVVAPHSVCEWLLHRLSRLPHESLALAKAVAVLDSDATFMHAARLARLNPDVAARVSDRLVAAEILHGDHGLRFTHPLLLSALYETMTAGERDRLHRSAATLLSELGEQQRAAAHLVRTRPSGRAEAAAMLAQAAERARRDGALDAAVVYLRRAIEEPPAAEEQQRLTGQLGRLEVAVGDDHAEAHLRMAIEGAPPQSTCRADLRLHLGQHLYLSGRLAEAVEVFDAAVNQLGEADPHLAMELQAAWAAVARLIPDLWPEARRRLERLIAQPPAGATHGERALLAQAASALVYAGEPRDLVLSLARTALGEGALVRDEGSHQVTWAIAAGALAWADHLQESQREIDRAFENAQANGSLIGFANASYVSSYNHHYQGHLIEASAHVQAAIEAHRGGWQYFLPAACAQQAWIFLDRGNLAAASAALALVEDDEHWQTTGMHALVLEARARLRLWQARPADALTDALTADRIAGRFLAPNPAVLPWRITAAFAHHRLGHMADAHALLEEDLRLAQRFGSPRFIGASLRAIGLIDGANDSVALLREAVATLRDSEAELELCRALIDLGGALRRDGYRRDAREPLGEGLELAHRFGAATLEQQARTELRSCGARPRRWARTGIDALTPTEDRVARLAASGLSNREIAQQLFVTLRTIEVHLSHAYTKLDITSRRELSVALSSAG